MIFKHRLPKFVLIYDTVSVFININENICVNLSFGWVIVRNKNLLYISEVFWRVICVSEGILKQFMATKFDSLISISYLIATTFKCKRFTVYKRFSHIFLILLDSRMFWLKVISLMSCPPPWILSWTYFYLELIFILQWFYSIQNLGVTTKASFGLKLGRTVYCFQ